MKNFVETVLPFTTQHKPGEADALVSVFSRTLRAIRTHLTMDVAFVSEFQDGRRVFRHVDGEDSRGVRVGGSDPLEDSYCQRVVDGRLPEVIADATVNIEALTLPATLALPVGAHLSVPIRLSDGRVYGTFCCFSAAANYALTPRDLDVMRVFAEVLADQIEQDLVQREAHQAAQARIAALLLAGDIPMAYQPIHDLMAQRIVGFEALARFDAEPLRTPDLWFAEAASVGRGVELELLAIRSALRALEVLPAPVYVAVNASPATIVDGNLGTLLDGLPLDRVVVEITEHAAVERYENLVSALRPLQQRGLRIAIDDAGAGYASFRHILHVTPDIIKMDISITRGIHADPSRRALATALHGFASETGSRILAEGVETVAELTTLRQLGFHGAQGYLLARPLKLALAATLCALR